MKTALTWNQKSKTICRNQCATNNCKNQTIELKFVVFNCAVMFVCQIWHTRFSGRQCSIAIVANSAFSCNRCTLHTMPHFKHRIRWNCCNHHANYQFCSLPALDVEFHSTLLLKYWMNMFCRCWIANSTRINCSMSLWLSSRLALNALIFDANTQFGGFTPLIGQHQII